MSKIIESGRVPAGDGPVMLLNGLRVERGVPDSVDRCEWHWYVLDNGERGAQLVCYMNSGAPFVAPTDGWYRVGSFPGIDGSVTTLYFDTEPTDG